MDTSATEIRAGLEALAAGDLDVGAARRAVRQAIAAGGCLPSEVYDTLRYATWRMMRAREVPEDIVEWHDLYTHAAALLQHCKRPDLAERLTALADLVAQTGRFADRQPLKDVLGRQHVASLLSRLENEGGKALRSILKDVSGLADANLSRVLGILSAYGLIRRRRLGKEAEIELTEAGHAAADAAAKAGAEQRHRKNLDVPLLMRAPPPAAAAVTGTAAKQAARDLDKLSKEVRLLEADACSDMEAIKRREVAGRAGYLIKSLSVSIAAAEPASAELVPLAIAALGAPSNRKPPVRRRLMP
jgi:DNA-binding MarR family transcriptional regulator